MDPIQDQKPFFKRLFSFKILLLIVLVVGLIEGYFLMKSFTLPFSPPPIVEAIKGGEINLIPSKDKLKVNEGTRVVIKISTGGRATQGTDVILKFDPKFLKVNASSLHKGEIYPDFPVFSINNKEGIIKISAISPSKNKTFKGVGILAFLDFIAKQSGNTKITVEFEKNKTDDSNIIEAGTSNDILEKVNQIDLSILP